MEFGDFEKLYFLSRCPILADLPVDALSSIAGVSEARRFNKGDSILTEGATIRTLYALAYGVLAVLVDGREVAENRAGDLIGDHEILSGRLRSGATVRVKSDYAWVLDIPRGEFIDLTNRESLLAGQMACAVGRRYLSMQGEINELGNLETFLRQELNHLDISLDSIQKIAREKERDSGTQVELRFLVNFDENDIRRFECRHLRQGYVALSDTDEIRVRDDGGNYSITGKRESGENRQEIDLAIDRPLFDLLLKHVSDRLITKRRFSIHYEGHSWHIDIFNNNTKCAGLKIAEVEITKGEEPPAPPPFIHILAEITSDHRFRNKQLAMDGVPSLSRQTG